MWQEKCLIPQFYKKPLTFIYLHHFTNSTPINTPLLSLSLHFTSPSSPLLPAANREATKRAPPLASLVHHLHLHIHHFNHHQAYHLQPSSLCEGRYPPFGLGPNFSSLDAAKIVVRRVISLSACLHILLTMRVTSLAKTWTCNSFFIFVFHVVRCGCTVRRGVTSCV